MKKTLTLIIILYFTFAITASAALTTEQVNSILGLLRSFGADTVTISNVETSLKGGTPSLSKTYNFGTTTLRTGSTGEAVKELQRFLNANLNLGLTIDGKFGTKTTEVIKVWQRDHQLTPDGLVGTKTKEMMNSLTTTSTTTSSTTPTPTPVVESSAPVVTGGGGGVTPAVTPSAPEPTPTPPSPPAPPADTTEPTRSSPGPSGTLTAGTTTTNLTLTTNETATCKYGTTATAYNSLSNTFSSTNSTTHSTSVSTSDGSSYTYYVRCSDSAGNVNTSDTAISFSVESPPPVVVIPLVGDEPVYNSGANALILQDNFDNYSGISSGGSTFRSLYPVYRVVDTNGTWVTMETLVHLITGRGDVGQALRLDYGTPNGASDIIVGPETRLGSVGRWNGTLPEVAGPYSHFYFTTWFRTSPGWNPVDRDITQSGIKGIMLWHSSGRYQHPVTLIAGGGGQRYAEARFSLSYPDSYTGLDHWRTQNNEAPYWSNYNDGNWHKFTSEVYTQSSGHVGERLWLDGILVYDNIDNLHSSNYTYELPISYFMVFGNFVTPAQVSNFGTIDFDDWTAWTDKP